MTINPHALHGAALDSAVADAMGWTIDDISSPNEPYYEINNNSARIPVQDWKPSLNPKQVIKIIIQFKISSEHNANRNIWRAYAIPKDGKIVEARAKKLTEAACRCLLLLQIANGEYLLDELN